MHLLITAYAGEHIFVILCVNVVFRDQSKEKGKDQAKTKLLICFTKIKISFILIFEVPLISPT